MTCPLDRTSIQQIKVLSNLTTNCDNIDKEILTISPSRYGDNINFEIVQKAILSIDNLKDRDEIEEMYVIDKYLLWIGPFIKNKGKVNREMIENYFKTFGIIEDVIVKENSAYIMFVSSQHGMKAKYKLDKEAFYGESIDFESFHPEMWDDL